MTGASDGIGLEFSTQLAKRGFSLILVSRTQSKLDDLASKLTSELHTECKTFSIDFAHATPSDYDRLNNAIKDLEISILINNVGKSHYLPVTFAQTPPDEIDDIITVNVNATLKVTSLVLPGMIKRQHGLILTMGSFGGLIPTPLLATYSGSKAFLQQWSSALGYEVAKHGITVELMQSYLVTSSMSKIRRSSVMVPTPKQFVRAALSKIGRAGGAQGWAYSSTPYWAHAMLQWVIVNTAGTQGELVVNFNGKNHEEIRRKGLKKLEARSAKKGS